MTLEIYNTLSRKKERFIPVEKGKIKMYVCGMTVYSDAHIGHARTYFAFDVIRRYFKYKGYKVTYVQNITDVDDKIIAAANREGVDPLDYSRRFTDRCLEDLDRLGIKRADVYPKASETIPDMIKMTEEIVQKGYGYDSDGDVYFSVDKFKDYGMLSGQKIDEMKVGARIEPGEQKRNPLDFALWKKSKPGEPSWDSPWGKGRPGWHIECSTMSSKYLGLPFDVHGGGMDLRFPHHENEIAQAEVATGKKFANYWMHIGLLTINGEKMSKSLGNIVNIRDLLSKWDSEVVRFFFAQTQYRSPPDFNDKALSDAEKGLERIHRLKEKIESLCKNVSSNKFNVKSLASPEKNYLDDIEDFKKKFDDSMDDDFNTPQAIATFFDFVNISNRFFEENKNPKKELCKYAFDVLVELGNVLTLFQPSVHGKDASEESVLLEKLYSVASNYDKNVDKTSIKSLMEKIMGVRERARKNKDWNLADKIRKELLDIGFELQDTQDGPVWRKK